MMVNCEVCHIVLSENDIPSHNTGKKHIKNLSKVKLDKNKQVVLLNNETAPSTSHDVDMDEVILPSEPANVKETTSSIKNKRIPEGQKKMYKRKLRDENPQTSLPEVFVNNKSDFDLQAVNFIMQVEQTQHEWNAIRWVLYDIEYIFGNVMPGVRPVLYGSSFSGLAFKTSDIDVYLHDPRRGEPDREFIHRDGGVIYRHRSFTNIVRIISARVPVIKATHTGTGIHIDISATSGQAVANSRMLRYLLSHDWRIRSMLMLLGYFGKKYTLIGVNKFSRYSVNLLVLFYLQNLAVPILPPLSKIVYGDTDRPWPYTFTEDRQMLINNNRQPLAELFMGFFEFYLNFPFDKYVISTYTGKKFPIEDMGKEEVLKQMIYYKNWLLLGGEKIVYRCICVQDPLELNHNTTKGLSGKVIQLFQFICTNVLKIKETAEERNWLSEMMAMNHIPPFFKRNMENNATFVVPFVNNTEGIWTDNIKEPLVLAFETLAINIDWNCPLIEDDEDEIAKKTKLSPGLSFSIETKQFIHPKPLKMILNQLKYGSFNIIEAKNEVLKIIQGRNQTVFSAQCFASTDQPNLIRITMKNNCTNKHAFNMLPILKPNLGLLLTAASKELEVGKSRKNLKIETSPVSNLTSG